MTKCRGSVQRPVFGLALVWLAALVSLPAFAASPPTSGAASGVAGGASASTPPGHQVATSKSKAASAAPVKLVDINSASRKELKTLPGIGDAEADKIIANRPYLTKTDLVDKNVLPVGPYLSLKNRIIAMQKNTRKVATP